MIEDNVHPSQIKKLTNSGSILRIFTKIKETRNPILIKPQDSGQILVKAMISSVDSQKFLVVSDISEKGLLFLKDKKDIQVKCSFLSTKIVFSSQILHIQDQKVTLSFPLEIFNVERRQNSRFEAPKEHPLFLQITNFDFPKEDGIKRPLYDPYQSWTHSLLVYDISLTGVCVTSSFPTFASALSGHKGPLKAKLLFPMAYSEELDMMIRWTKRFLDPVPAYRIGFSFVQPPLGVIQGIKSYVHQTQNIKAI